MAGSLTEIESNYGESTTAAGPSAAVTGGCANGGGGLGSKGSTGSHDGFDDTDGLPAELVKAVRGGSLLKRVRWPLMGNWRLGKMVWRSVVLEVFWEEVAPQVEEAMALTSASRAFAAIATSGDNQDFPWDGETLKHCKLLTPAHLRQRCRPSREAGSTS